MIDNLTKTAPENIYLWSEHTEGRDETFMGGNWSTVQHEDYESVEYVRADLVPTWKSLPDCVGQWMNSDREVWSIYHAHPDKYLCFLDADMYDKPVEKLFAWRWFGPIPEDK